MSPLPSGAQIILLLILVHPLIGQVKNPGDIQLENLLAANHTSCDGNGPGAAALPVGGKLIKISNIMSSLPQRVRRSLDVLNYDSTNQKKIQPVLSENERK